MSEPAIPVLVLAPGEDIHDPEALYAIATAYAHSGLIVSKHGYQTDQMAFAFPAIVCSSFALELFLKFFLMVDLVEKGDTEQKIRNIHTIPELWKLVTPEHKALIAGMFRNSTGEPLTTGIELRLQLFEEALKHLGSKPFVQWRYIHELRSQQLMSHGAISIVVDAFGHAAQYVVKKMRAQRANPASNSESPEGKL